MSNNILNNIDISTKELIVDGLQNSVELYKDFKEQGLFNTTHNCYAFARWDSINETLAQKFREMDLPFANVRKFSWALLLFCDKSKSVVFSAMRRDRFSYICGNPQKRAPQYFDSLVSLNSDLEAIASQPGFEECYEASDRYNQLASLCSVLPNPKNEKFTHVVVIFDVYGDEITSIELCVINNKFEIVEQEDIMQTVLTARQPVIEAEEITEAIEQPAKQKGFVKLKNIKNIEEKA